MSNDVFNTVIEQTQSYVAPVVKANKLAVTNLEKLVSFQFEAAQSYVDLGIRQLKAAAEVSNPQDLQSFFGSQVEFLNVLRQKLLDDTKAIADLSAGFKAEFDKLAEENVTELTEKATKVTRAAAKKTAAAA